MVTVETNDKDGILFSQSVKGSKALSKSDIEAVLIMTYPSTKAYSNRSARPSKRIMHVILKSYGVDLKKFIESEKIGFGMTACEQVDLSKVTIRNE